MLCVWLKLRFGHLLKDVGDKLPLSTLATGNHGSVRGGDIRLNLCFRHDREKPAGMLPQLAPRTGRDSNGVFPAAEPSGFLPRVLDSCLDSSYTANSQLQRNVGLG